MKKMVGQRLGATTPYWTSFYYNTSRTDRRLREIDEIITLYPPRRKKRKSGARKKSKKREKRFNDIPTLYERLVRDL